MILQYVFNTGIQYFVWVLQHTLPKRDVINCISRRYIYSIKEYHKKSYRYLTAVFMQYQKYAKNCNSTMAFSRANKK